MRTGKVKFFNKKKGFGFITDDENGKDVFVHVTGLDDSNKRTIKEGDNVEYESRDGKKGINAVNVTIID